MNASSNVCTVILASLLWSLPGGFARAAQPSPTQAVVDGTTQVLGSNGRALSSAIAHAALSPKQELTIGNAQWSGDTVHFTVHSAAAPRATLVAVLAEDVTHSTVTSGENAGRTLLHVAVTRALKKMDAGFADGRPLTLKLPSANKSKSTGNAVPLRLVVFLADSAAFLDWSRRTYDQPRVGRLHFAAAALIRSGSN